MVQPEEMHTKIEVFHFISAGIIKTELLKKAKELGQMQTCFRRGTFKRSFLFPCGSSKEGMVTSIQHPSRERDKQHCMELKQPKIQL